MEDNNKDEIILSLEDIFVNLRLISKIEIGNKLIHDDKHVNIDTSYFQSISRWYNGMNRKSNLEFINIVLNTAFKYNDEEKSSQVKFRLTSDLKNAIQGLTNLKLTYSYDKLIQSEIDVMIENIRLKIDANSNIIKF
jgi:hypothetical protein